jgi:hypothetical protein
MNAEKLLLILNTDPFNPLLYYPHKTRDPNIAHAPKRPLPLNDGEKRVTMVFYIENSLLL